MSETTAQSNGSAPPQTAEVLVVGAGVAGLLAAWRFAAAGAEVLVVDDGARRPPASLAAAGMIAPVGEASWGEERSHEASLWSAREWPRLAAELAAEAGCEVPLRACGAVHVALDRDEAAELDRLHGLHERLGLDSRPLRPSEARGLEPGLGRGVSAALYAPGEAEVDPRRLAEAVASAAGRRGVRFHHGRVEAVEGQGVRLEAGHIVEAGRIVLAPGAWAGRIEGVPAVPIRPVRGEILRLRAEAGGLPCERIVRGERFYVVPRRDGEVVVGATSQERGFDTAVQAGAVLELLREAQRALPDLGELRFLEAGAALRPATPDNAPILDLSNDRVLLAGLYRHGILLAPLVAAFADAAARGARIPEPARGLGLGRFRCPGKPLEVRA